jgi:hypothetical protein
LAGYRLEEVAAGTTRRIHPGRDEHLKLFRPDEWGVITNRSKLRSRLDLLQKYIEILHESSVQTLLLPSRLWRAQGVNK